jgi:nucleoside-triphosphatase THEP1
LGNRNSHPPIYAVKRDDPEAADRVVAAVIAAAEERGLEVVGVYQKNIERVDRMHNDMHLVSLCDGAEFKISEDRGEHSSGCRLDRDVIARAALEVERSIAGGRAEFLVLNKFGKAEEEGGGMREAIALALEADIPILMTVGRWSVGALLDFAGPYVEVAEADLESGLAWFRAGFETGKSAANGAQCVETHEHLAPTV